MLGGETSLTEPERLRLWTSLPRNFSQLAPFDGSLFGGQGEVGETEQVTGHPPAVTRDSLTQSQTRHGIVDLRGAAVFLEAFCLSQSQETTAKQKSKRSQTADGFSSQSVDLGYLERKESLEAEKQGVRDVTVHTLFYLAGVAGVKTERTEKAHNHAI